MPSPPVLAPSPPVRHVASAQDTARPPLHAAAWVAVAAGVPIAASCLVISGIGIALASVGPLLGILMLLIAARHVYTRHRPDERIAATCGMLAVMIAAALLAAIISHTSLRFALPYIDSTLSAADAIFGIRAPAIVLAFAQFPAFANVLAVFYNTSLPVCFLCGLALALSGRAARADEFAFAFAANIIFAATVSIFLPALGSTVFNGMEGTPGLPPSAGNFHMATVDYFRNDPTAVFDLARLQGIVTFPSFHMVMALLVPHALRDTRWLARAAIVWAALVTLSAVVIGGHYVIDLLAGAITWGAVVWLGRHGLRAGGDRA